MEPTTEITLAAPTSTTRAANAAERAAGNVEHALKIATAMAPDAKEWSFQGEVVDAGGEGAFCACGHAIRYVFILRRMRDGATLPIGSVCIESTVPVLMTTGAERLAGQLAAALEAHRKALADAQKAIRDAEASVEVQGLMAELNALKAWALDAKANRVFLPRSLWELTAGRIKPVKAASTPGRTAASLRTRLTPFYVAAIHHGLTNGRVSCPLPKDRKLITKVAEGI